LFYLSPTLKGFGGLWFGFGGLVNKTGHKLSFAEHREILDHETTVPERDNVSHWGLFLSQKRAEKEQIPSSPFLYVKVLEHLSDFTGK